MLNQFEAILVKFCVVYNFKKQLAITYFRISYKITIGRIVCQIFDFKDIIYKLKFKNIYVCGNELKSRIYIKVKRKDINS